MTKENYDPREICAYYARDGGHCHFSSTYGNEGTIPSLAGPQINRPGALRYVCTARNSPQGNLLPESIVKQKTCDRWEARERSGHISGVRRRMGF